MGTYLAVAAVLTMTLAGASRGDVSANADATQPGSANSTTVRAIVLDVARLDFPRARLALRVTESSNKRVLDLKGGRPTVVAENYLWGTKEGVDCLDSRNVGSIAAYYLLRGDEIRAKMYSRVEADRPDRQPYPARGDCQYYIFDIERMNLERGAKQSILKDDLELTLEVEKQAHLVSEPVRLTFTVKNVGVGTKILRFSSGQRHDFVVAVDGREVWRWSYGKYFTQALTSATLAPGETITFEEVWRQEDNEGGQVQPGEYKVTAVLTTMGKPRPTVGPVSVTIRSKE